MKPPIPANEPERLALLQRYEILDTESEKAFDDLTTLAARICAAPVALISLVDSDRQWFKSRVGLSATETSRDVSFCGHAIVQPELFIVPDALEDPRFARNPLVTSEPYIRFYAGASLRTPQGCSVGTLCVIDHVPRELTEAQRDTLRVLADAVVTQLELRRQVKELTESEAGRARLVTELRESERQFRDLTEGSVQGVLIGRDGAPLFANQALAEMFGYEDADEIIRLGSDDALYGPDELPRIKQYRAADSDQYAALPHYEFQGVRKDGTKICVETRTRVISWHGEPAFQSTMTDVTDRKRAEDALHESVKELEAFSYSVAHDLKAPLRAMQGFSHILLQDYQADLDDTGREYLSHIAEGAKRMGYLIDDLLSFSALGRQDPQFQLVDLNDVLARAERNIADELAASGAEVRLVKTLPSIEGHPVILELVMQNLLSNAAKFARPNTPPVIDVSAKDDDGFCVISVRDNGIGIEPEYGMRIFEIFQRLHTRDEYAGTGIGLAIVKKAVTLHKGTVWVESEPGEGSVFSLRLPKRQEK